MPALRPFYSTPCRDRLLAAADAKTIEGIATALEQLARALREVDAAGVVLTPGRGGGGSHFLTTDPEVAVRFQMRECG